MVLRNEQTLGLGAFKGNEELTAQQADRTLRLIEGTDMLSTAHCMHCRIHAGRQPVWSLNRPKGIHVQPLKREIICPPDQQACCGALLSGQTT